MEEVAGRGIAIIARGGSSDAIKPTVISDSSTESETVEVSDAEDFHKVENKINIIRTQFYEAKKRLTKAKGSLQPSVEANAASSPCDCPPARTASQTGSLAKEASAHD